MLSPQGIAFDSSGTLWVADTGNHRVLRFDNASMKATPTGGSADAVLGQSGFTTKTTALSNSGMANPSGLAAGNEGTLWVADTGNDRVLRFANASSKANGAASEGVLGQPDHTTNGADFPITAANLNSPNDVAISPTGVLWVADTERNRILRYDNAVNKSNGSDADGILGPSSFSLSSFGTTEDRMLTPWGLSLAPNGDLWTTERVNNRVLRFANAATKSNGAAADTVLGQPDFTTDAAGVSANKLNAPRKPFAVNNNQILVADADNHRVLRFSIENNTAARTALLKKIKKTKKALKRAKKSRKVARVKSLKKKLKKLQKKLRALS